MKTCRTCKTVVLEKTIKNYHYTECGLPNIYLAELTAYHCSLCDEQSLSFRSIARLHDALREATADDTERKCTFLCKEATGDQKGWTWTLLNENEAEMRRIMNLAYEYGYHRNKCIIMAQMKGPTPITTPCNCGWQDFADELRQRLGK